MASRSARSRRRPKNTDPGGTGNQSVLNVPRLQHPTKIPTTQGMRDINIRGGDVGLLGALKRATVGVREIEPIPIITADEALEDLEMIMDQNRQREAVGIAAPLFKAIVARQRAKRDDEGDE